MRLIDADYAKTLWNNDINISITMRQIFDALPTIDAVPVVRCQECKHKNTTACPAYDAPFMRTSLRIKFCSEGKRKEGDHVRNN